MFDRVQLVRRKQPRRNNMPTYRTGNMWDAFGETDWFLFTSNPIISKDGQAVMGRGMALELAKAFPEIRYDMAKKVNDDRNVHTVGYYGPTRQRVGYFMVKEHWRDRASLDLIENSCYDLADIIYTLEDTLGRGLKVDLNFPGIGNGGLDREQVKPLLDGILPANVHIWEYGK